MLRIKLLAFAVALCAAGCASFGDYRVHYSEEYAKLASWAERMPPEPLARDFVLHFHWEHDGDTIDEYDMPVTGRLESQWLAANSEVWIRAFVRGLNMQINRSQTSTYGERLEEILREELPRAGIVGESAPAQTRLMLDLRYVSSSLPEGYRGVYWVQATVGRGEDEHRVHRQVHWIMSEGEWDVDGYLAEPPTLEPQNGEPYDTLVRLTLAAAMALSEQTAK